MNVLLVALALGIAWSDPSGKLNCPVPDGFTPRPQQPWVFTRADGLRKLVFLTVRPVAAGPDARAAELLGKVPREEAVNVGVAIAPLEPTWAGVVVLGPPAADVKTEAQVLTSGCRSVLLAVDGRRIRDASRRLSADVPAGLTPVDVRGAGAANGPGFTIRLTSLQPKPQGALADIAAQWLVPTGAKLESTEDTVVTQRGLLASIATGTLSQPGAEYVFVIAVIDFGNGEVGGLSMSTHASTRGPAQAAMNEMLRTMAIAWPAPPSEPQRPR